MTGLLQPGEYSSAEQPFVWGFVGTVWEGGEATGGVFTQGSLHLKSSWACVETTVRMVLWLMSVWTCSACTLKTWRFPGL